MLQYVVGKLELKNPKDKSPIITKSDGNYIKRAGQTQILSRLEGKDLTTYKAHKYYRMTEI